MGTVEDRRRFAIDSLESDWSWNPNDTLSVQFGSTLARVRGRYDYRDDVELAVLFDAPGASSEAARARSIQTEPRGEQYALYGSVRLNPTPQLTMDFGARWDKQTLDPGHSDTRGPRIGIRYRIGAASYLRGSWGRFYQSQSINELQVEDGVETFYPPQRADHAVLGFEHDFANGINLRLEAYDKDMRSLRPRYENLLNPLALLAGLKPDRIAIAPSGARARGVELFVSQRTQHELSWWVGYSRSWVEDRIDGERIVRSWDQAHAVSGGLSWDTPTWNVGLGALYRSGWPTTSVALDAGGAMPVVAAGARNSARLDNYRTADLRLTRKFELDRGALSAFIEVSNVFDWSNPCCTEYEVELTESGDFALGLSRLNYLPRVPSIGFTWSF